MKVFFDTVGCRLNQAEIEQFAAQFRSQGYEIAADYGDADVVVINTCAVTAAAASDSRNKIRNAGKSGKARIIITGCWSEMEPEIAKNLPGVSQIIPNKMKDSLTAIALGIESSLFDLEPIKREPLPGIHARTRAFIKVQDGCDNFCTFCVTRLVRGKAQSISADQVLKSIQSVMLADGKEIVLTGVNLGAWGLDFERPEQLTDLIKTILHETDIPRIRLSSLESWNISGEFVELWKDTRLCPHFHIPLQSGSENVLKRMARRTTLPEFLELVKNARIINPDFAITTDVIVGFPGETDDEFRQTVDFVKEIGFAGGHVFSYSSRPGTAAARMGGIVHGSVIKERSGELRDVFQQQKEAFHRSFIGKELQVLWENGRVYDGGNLEQYGMTGNYLTIKSDYPIRLQNKITRTKIESFDGEVLVGKILIDSSEITNR
ncbi:MAG: tRNA (N(6)-L-threonylcarbamoyladenosine(37)-C(2))-methylthiotransferase MtaB [Flexilinea sp.]